MKIVYVKSNPEAAAKALGSNRSFSVGQKISCSDLVASQLVSKHADLFGYDVPVEQAGKNVAAVEQVTQSKAPEANKMARKGKKYKSKDIRPEE